MKELFENNEIEVETSGTECPIPVLKARKVCQNASKGQIIKVITTDPLAEADFRHYCDQSNYKFISISKIKKTFYIKFKV